MERLDKFLSNAEVLTRSQCKIAIKRKLITVNGVIINDASMKIDENVDEICYDGKKVEYNEFVYIMLNKPSGVVSATDDGNYQTVIDIIPPTMKKKGLFPCGRLDKDTVGLVIITNDGVSAHRRLAPKSKTEKLYYFETAEVIKNEEVITLEKGVTLNDGFTTAPCKITLKSDKSGEIILTEGKYHEIKRLFGYTGNKVTYLKRIAFNNIKLDESLLEGECRYLTADEIKLFTM